jgi:hypothetical protein
MLTFEIFDRRSKVKLESVRTDDKSGHGLGSGIPGLGDSVDIVAKINNLDSIVISIDGVGDQHLCFRRKPDSRHDKILLYFSFANIYLFVLCSKSTEYSGTLTRLEDSGKYILLGSLHTFGC